jgi:hypothetical protein
MAKQTKEEETEFTELAPRTTQIIRAAPADLMLTPAFDLDTAQNRLAELQKFVEFYMKEGEDFGKIPGTPKPTLYKSGADKLCDIYALADKYQVTNRTEDWDRSLFDYEVECSLVSKRTGQLVSTGLGSCNSFEGKYRWRENKRACPACGKETIIKGKEEYGGGWLCWRKEGKSDGCGAKFPIEDDSIISQQVGKTQNDDVATLKNTILKMAKKRAKVDAVLSATRSSGLFTQDMDDIQPAEEPPANNHKSQEPPKKAAPPAARTAKPASTGQENVTLTPYKEGFVALSGNGLPIVRSNLDNKMMAELGWKWEGNIAIIPAKNGFKFVDLCKKHNVGTIWMEAPQRGPLAPPKANIPPMPVIEDEPEPSNGSDPIITSAKRVRGTKPGAKEYLAVEWDGKRASCWGKRLWPHIEHHVGRPAVLTLETKGQYTNVVGIVSLDGEEFFTEPIEDRT